LGRNRIADHLYGPAFNSAVQKQGTTLTKVEVKRAGDHANERELIAPSRVCCPVLDFPGRRSPSQNPPSNQRWLDA
jgi:hypothetical protein